MWLEIQIAERSSGGIQMWMVSSERYRLSRLSNERLLSEFSSLFTKFFTYTVFTYREQKSFELILAEIDKRFSYEKRPTQEEVQQEFLETMKKRQRT